MILFRNVSEVRYDLVISYVGYETKTMTGISVLGSSPDHNVGVVKVDPTSVMLGGVQVTAERTPEELRPDKEVINVSQDLAIGRWYGARRFG